MSWPRRSREYLRVGGLDLGGLGLAEVAAAQTTADTSVILV
jgi:hypothetical protein